jgi:hypothetical protein
MMQAASEQRQQQRQAQHLPSLEHPMKPLGAQQAPPLRLS